MKERPILFSSSMIQAVLKGQKKQTRRIAKVTSDNFLPGFITPIGCHCPRSLESHVAYCPYGKPGDILWVREMWSGEYWLRGVKPSERLLKTNPSRLVPIIPETWYWADGDPDRGDWEKPRPSIHMPRWASRITLEITGVRVELLNDISEEDAQSEGAQPSIVGGDLDYLKYRAGFQTLWESINGAGSWSMNPWCWCISFRRV